MLNKVLIIGLFALLNWQHSVSQKISIEKLPFCKKHVSEIAPTISDSVLYYSSNQNVKWASKSTDQDNQNFYNLFSTQQKVDSSWTKASQYLPKYFSEFHTSTITFHQKSNKVYFTEVQYKKKKNLKDKSENLHGVFQANIDGQTLTRPESLPFNSRRHYNTGHPTISSDGQFLFFTSDKEGGAGLTDIYVATKKDNEWGEPTNMGNVINTQGNELFPFYHSSGKLFFASDGHGGQGGLDLFYTRLTTNGWIKPVPLEKNINTSANEFSCYIQPDEQSGYFASDRDGDDDLYEFVRLFPIFGPGKKQKENTFRYRFYDRMNGKGDGPVKYVWHFGDGQKAEGDTVIHKYKKPGSYLVKSVLVDTVENAELFVLNEFFQEVKPKIQVYISIADTVRINELQTLDAKKSHLGDFNSDGYYWELPDGSRQKGETIQYIFRTKGIHRIKCGTVSINDPQEKMCTYKEVTVIE